MRVYYQEAELHRISLEKSYWSQELTFMDRLSSSVRCFEAIASTE